MGEDGESSKGGFGSRFADSIAQFNEDSNSTPYKNTDLLGRRDDATENSSSGAVEFQQAVTDAGKSSSTRSQ